MCLSRFAFHIPLGVPGGPLQSLSWCASVMHKLHIKSLLRDARQWPGRSGPGCRSRTPLQSRPAPAGPNPRSSPAGQPSAGSRVTVPPLPSPSSGRHPPGRTSRTQSWPPSHRPSLPSTPKLALHGTASLRRTSNTISTQLSC
eukprot:192247-Rhodomonas_salina.1